MNLCGLDAIIFDFDGVLVESVDVKTRAFAAMYAKHGDDVVAKIEDYHLRHGGESRFEKFRYYQNEILGGPPLVESELEELGRIFSEMVVEQVVAAPMVKGAQEFLDSCNDQLPLFVVSGTPIQELAEIVRRRNMQDLFRAIRGSPGTKTEHIAELLREFELDPGRCLMFGDAMTDYVGARSNSVNFLGRVARGGIDPFPDETIKFDNFLCLPANWNTDKTEG